MTKEVAEKIRAIIVPYMMYDLRYINYENMGEIDAEQFSEDMNEISDLAAKALEQEPCEDAVSRKAVLEYIERSDAELGHSSENKLVCQDIKEFPSVTPTRCIVERKKGKWVLHTYMPHKNYCSECEKNSPYNKRWDFCPNCGAKMEVEE